MTIPPGSRLGPYEVLSPLGAGGMGEVYRARDSRLDRSVAIKVLPEEFFEDRDRVARFEREAKALAALTHAGIAAVHSFEALEGRHLLVMELVEGEGLDVRIARGPIPIDEALPIARQIAGALEAAHDRGIVHRDLKPANVMVGHDGKVKLLDFGLAKALDAEAASGGTPSLTQSPTLTGRATVAGVILGTAAYMSPEQARGKPVDKRADIWAFGAVLYEMLTGRRAFEGETVSDMLAAVLKTDPDWKALPEGTPPNVRKVLHRCLERDRDRRFHDIADARIDLEASPDEPFAATQPGAAEPRAKRPIAAWAAAGVLFVLAAVLAAMLLSRRASPRPPVRASILFPPKTQLGLDTIQPGPPTISPDGRSIVFVLKEATGARRLWLRRIDWPDARPIDGTDDASYPFWSPDSRNIGFFSEHKLKKVPATGGPVLSVCDAPNAKGGAWSPDDIILFSPSFSSPIFRVPAGGGSPVPVTKVDTAAKEASHRFPQFLPGGRRFLYLARRDGAKNLLRVGSLDGGQSETILETDQQGVYSSGFLLFVRDRTLMAQPFDGKKLSGQALPLAQGIRVIPGAAYAVLSASEAGAVVYLTGEATGDSRLVWVDQQGKRIGTVGEPAVFDNPALSPDGKRVAVEILDPALGTFDIWTLDSESGNRMRLTFDPGNELRPVWSPDGRRLAYASLRAGVYDIFIKDIGGSGEEKAALPAQDVKPGIPAGTRPNRSRMPDSWSSDGRFLLYSEENSTTGVTEIIAQDLTGKEAPRSLVTSSRREPAPAISPDGRWVAYCAQEGGPGSAVIVVFSFADPRKRWQV
ncbi:MAG TPA: protein kinase, partial [Thermoanaerobaculia bacterium]|nr:protein kinase [Thermoanaerobaculia bacterium]